MAIAVLYVALAASILAADVGAAPGGQMTMLDSPGSPGDDGVLLVPLQAPPVPVRDAGEEEEEEEGEDADPWDLLSSWLEGLQETPDGATSAPSADTPAGEGGPLKYFSSVRSFQSSPGGRSFIEATNGDGDKTVVFRVGRGLKSAEDMYDEARESRVLEGADDPMSADDAMSADDTMTADYGVEDERHPRARRALRVVVRQADQDGAGKADDDAELRADAAPAPAAPGSFLENVQSQLPGQLQGLGGAMEESKMIVGTFQALIMPGSAATDFGQQITGFMSNMPQIPSLPGGGR